MRGNKRERPIVVDSSTESTKGPAPLGPTVERSGGESQTPQPPMMETQRLWEALGELKEEIREMRSMIEQMKEEKQPEAAEKQPEPPAYEFPNWWVEPEKSAQPEMEVGEPSTRRYDMELPVSPVQPLYPSLQRKPRMRVVDPLSGVRLSWSWNSIEEDVHPFEEEYLQLDEEEPEEPVPLPEQPLPLRKRSQVREMTVSLSEETDPSEDTDPSEGTAPVEGGQ